MMPFHNEDHICGGNDTLVDYAGRSGIEPGGRDLKPRPPRKQRFRRRAAQAVAGADKQNSHASPYHDPAGHRLCKTQPEDRLKNRRRNPSFH
jgi:hypothetical protein